MLSRRGTAAGGKLGPGITRNCSHAPAGSSGDGESLQLARSSPPLPGRLHRDMLNCPTQPAPHTDAGLCASDRSDDPGYAVYEKRQMRDSNVAGIFPVSQTTGINTEPSQPASGGPRN